MANLVNWNGASGTRYTFELHLDGTMFNPVSGVYIFARQVSIGSFEALYVGEASSLKQRLNDGISNHDGYARAKRLGATHIAAMVVHGDAERLRVETDLRHGLDPAANRQSVPNMLTGRH